MTKTIKHILWTTLFFTFCQLTYAAQVDTLDIQSARMNKKIKTVVILPDNYQKAHPFPYCTCCTAGQVVTVTG